MVRLLYVCACRVCFLPCTFFRKSIVTFYVCYVDVFLSHAVQNLFHMHTLWYVVDLHVDIIR